MKKLALLIKKHNMPIGRLAKRVGVGPQAIRNLVLNAGTVTRKTSPGEIKAKTMVGLCEQFEELEPNDFVRTKLRFKR